jgi:hypothetical protein
MDAAAYKLLRRAGCLLIGIGLAGSVLCSLSFLMLNYAAFDPSVSFSLLTWSSSGDRLAFVVIREYHTRSLYVIDANGEHLTRVVEDFCDALDDCAGGLVYLRWSEDGQTLYFANDGYQSTDYGISIDGTHLRKIAAAEVPPPPTLLSPIGPTLCDDADFVGEQSFSRTGNLVAQGIRPSIRNLVGNGEFQVCDLRTGERLFTFDSFDYGRAQNQGSILAKPLPIFISIGIVCIGIAILVWLKANR